MTLGQGELADLKRIVDILMGAAHADGTLDGREVEVVQKIIDDLLGDDEVPPELHERIVRFDTRAFNLAETTAGLFLESPQARRALLALVARVSAADDVHDLDEDDYLRRLADLIGATPDECKGLGLEVVSVEALGVAPPPVPGQAGRAAPPPLPTKR